MTVHHYVKHDTIRASSFGPILDHIEQDFQTRFSRDFFHLSTSEKRSYNVHQESVLGAGIDDDFHIPTDTGPIWTGSIVTRTLGSKNRSLSDAKGRLKARLTETFVERRDSGVVVMLGSNSILIDTSIAAQQEVGTLVRRLERVGGYQAVRTRSGSILSVDLTTAKEILNAIEDHIANIWNNEATLGSSIDAATDIAQLKAIDLDNGWSGR